MRVEGEVDGQEGEKRAEIVRAAFDVFYRAGFHATAIDKVLADTGISKRTLYRYFRTKEELIAATIAYYHRRTFSRLEEEIRGRKGGAKERILALFDLKYDEFRSGNFSGCFAVNAKLEYESKHPDIEKACVTFLEELERFVLSLVMEGGIKGADTKARQIVLLFEGTIVYGQSKRDPAIAKVAREMAEAVLER